MAVSRQDARRPPPATAQASRGDSARQAPTSRFDQKIALRVIRLGTLRHMLRSSRFYERVALVFIVLQALRGLGQENQASTMARLSAWNKREVQRLEHKVERIEHKVKH